MSPTSASGGVTSQNRRQAYTRRAHISCHVETPIRRFCLRQNLNNCAVIGILSYFLNSCKNAWKIWACCALHQTFVDRGAKYPVVSGNFIRQTHLFPATKRILPRYGCPKVAVESKGKRAIPHEPPAFLYFDGIIDLIHASKLLGFRVCIRTTPGPRKRHTRPSPDVMLEIHPLDAFSMV